MYCLFHLHAYEAFIQVTLCDYAREDKSLRNYQGVLNPSFIWHNLKWSMYDAFIGFHINVGTIFVVLYLDLEPHGILSPGK